MTCIVSVSTGSVVKELMAGMIGIFLSTVGGVPTLIAAIFVGFFFINLLLVPLGIMLSRVAAPILRIREGLMMKAIIILCVVGISIATFFCAPFAVKIAHKLDAPRLRLAFAVFLGISAAKMLSESFL